MQVIEHLQGLGESLFKFISHSRHRCVKAAIKKPVLPADIRKVNRTLRFRETVADTCSNHMYSEITSKCVWNNTWQDFKYDNFIFIFVHTRLNSEHNCYSQHIEISWTHPLLNIIKLLFTLQISLLLTLKIEVMTMNNVNVGWYFGCTFNGMWLTFIRGYQYI